MCVIYEDNSWDFFINLLVAINTCKIIHKIFKQSPFLPCYFYDIV